MFPGISPFNAYGSPFQGLLSTGLTVGLGALAFKLFSTDGFAAGAKKVVGDVLGNEDPLGALGKFLGGNEAKPAENASAESTEPKKSGVPGWLKALGIGVAGMTALNFVTDTFSMGMGMPLFGGFGLGFPSMGYQGIGTGYTPFGPFGYPMPY